ncbi:hypothetical protein ACMFMG_007815 [Clarireedia jacksonii]
MAGGNGTNPIHNKKPKKKVVEEDDEDKAHKAKLLAGKSASLQIAPISILTDMPYREESKRRSAQGGPKARCYENGTAGYQKGRQS